MALGEIGRRSETMRLRAVLEQSRRERGPVVAVVRGEPGAGKSTLLDAFRVEASAVGFRVAVVRGTGTEGRPYSTANRLIAQLRADDGKLVEIQHRTPSGNDLGGPVAAVPTGRDVPVALCVDDMAQVDSWSLRWLLELSRTLPPAPLAIVLTVRICGAGAGAVSGPANDSPDEPGTALLAAAEPIDLPGLRTHDLAEAAAARCRVRLDTRTAAVCREFTGGNPALLHALLAPHTGSAPTADALHATAASGALTGADRWLAPLSTSALALAWAVAVLGGGAEVVDSAELAHLTVGEALGAVDQLVEACLLANHTPLAFRHPLLETMVLGRIAVGTRTALHLRAAALLRDRQAATTTVAHHLAAAGPLGEEWAMRCLWRAARQLEQEGRHQDAAHCLRAALREPLCPHEKSAVRRELAELDAFADPEGAVRLLDAARCESHDPGVVLEYALALAAMLAECGRAEDAVTVLDDAAARLGRTAGDDSWQLRLRLHKAFAGRRGPLWLAQAADDPLGNLTCRTSHQEIASRELAALRAVQAVDAGADRAAAVRHARQGLPRGEECGSAGSATLLWHTCGVLVAAGEVAEAWTHCGRGRQVAGARPGRWDHIKVELLRAMVLRARGDLHGADAILTPLADRLLAFAATGHPSAVTGVAALAEVRVLKGLTDSARSLFAESGLEGDPLPWRRDSAHALAARAAVHESDDPARALEDLLAAGRLLEEAGVRNPAVLPWRSRAARLLAARGERKEAAEFAGAEVDDARRWGTPESLGGALHALALTETGERRIDLLTDAAGLLARSSDRLHHAFVQADLGAGLAELGRGEEARAELLSALRLARACGAEPLARRVQGAWRSLRGTGGGPLGLSGTRAATPTPSAAPDSASVAEPSAPPASALHAAPQPGSPLLDRLTPQERKVLHLAKDGHSNRDIAGRLFVAVRTVEFHLSGAYRKLGITGRRQLAQVFSGG